MQKAPTNKTTTAANTGLPTNFRRKRRHSEPHLQATKPYKNFVTHWKLETKKPAQSTQQSSSAGASPQLPTENHSQSNNNNGGNWSPSTSEAMKSFKKDGHSSPSNPRSGPHPRGSPQQPQQSQPQSPVRWIRRSSLPHIYNSNTEVPNNSGIARSAILEEPEASEINFPPSHHEYQFPPITLNFPLPPQQDVLFRSKDDLAPFLGNRKQHDLYDRNLPSLQSVLEHVSLSDDGEPLEDQQGQAVDEVQPRIKRRMSIDSLLG